MNVEETHSGKVFAFIILSFFIGFILEIVPLPHWIVWARPEWVFLILLFWVLACPHLVGVFTAFCLGILMDLLTGTLLGQHAFSYVLVVFIVLAFHPRLKIFPLGQQIGIIFLLSLLQLALQCLALEIFGMTPQSLLFWLSAFSSLLIWPWFYILLRDGQEMIRGYR